jgi:hypothetical protein
MKHAARFFHVYFQRDCLREDPDWESVVLRFRQSEPFELVRSTDSELASMLREASESELEAFIFGPECRSAYDPRPEGLTLRAWLEEILHLLAGGSPRSSDRVAVSRARRAAAAIARAALAGAIDPILAARELAALRFSVDVPPDDSDFTIFVAIHSETDSFPIGPERERWAPDALLRLESELARARERASVHGRPAFANVAKRFGGSGFT